MEHDAYRWWVVRDITWCSICGQREVNGTNSDLCAPCEALDLELEEAIA